MNSDQVKQPRRQRVPYQERVIESLLLPKQGGVELMVQPPTIYLGAQTLAQGQQVSAPLGPSEMCHLGFRAYDYKQLWLKNGKSLESVIESIRRNSPTLLGSKMSLG